MAVTDVFRSLPEEQQERLCACRSLPEIGAVIKAEGIAFTAEHLEAIYGMFGFEVKKARANAIETGLFGRFIIPTQEWRELLCEAQENERAIRRRFPSPAEQEAAACELIAGENEMLWLSLLTAEDVRAFQDFCLKLRGGFPGAKQRRLAREQVRLLGYLADGAPIPDSIEAVLSLWETANRLEPRWYDELSAHFRTSGEHTPFSHGRNPLVPGAPPMGHLSSPPDEIPEDVSRLLEWIQRRDLPRELAAFTAFLQLLRIHPFPDGNGHTARLLCCGMLTPAYSEATLTAFLRQMRENSRSVSHTVIAANVINGDICPECCALIHHLIRGQKRLLAREA